MTEEQLEEILSKALSDNSDKAPGLHVATFREAGSQDFGLIITTDTEEFQVSITKIW